MAAPFDLNDDTVVVVIGTGAGGGVGRETARRLAEAGARVLIADRDEEELSRVAEEIAEEGGEAVAFPCDVTEALSASNITAATLDAFDRIDILINGARTVIPGRMFDTDQDALGETFDVNVRATFRLSQAVARRMIQYAEADEDQSRPAGAIVNISSIAARRTATSASASICARSFLEVEITSASRRMPTALKALFSSSASNGVWSSAVSETDSSDRPFLVRSSDTVFCTS